MRLNSICVVATLFFALLLPSRAAAAEEPLCAPPIPVVDVGLDPGHSRADVGAAGGGLTEYEITLPIALRVSELLASAGLSAALSRYDHLPLTDFLEPDPVKQVRVEQEARIAAVGNARVYLSIHLNGFGDATVRGAESYYNSDNHALESRGLANAIHRHLLSEVRDVTGYQLPNRGVREDLSAGKSYGHFFSLRGDMPSVLVEAMFLSNPQEAALIARRDAREAVAKGIAAGIIEYFNTAAP